MIYVQLATGFDKEKREFYKQKALEILPSVDSKQLYSYLLGEIALVDQNREKALQYYIESSGHNKMFNHPKVKALALIT